MNRKQSAPSMPLHCPSCGKGLRVQRLLCRNCDTAVEGSYLLPVLSQMPKDDQAFISEFVKASGSLKEMASRLKVSYPTVRNRLDEIIARLKQAEEESEGKNDA